MSTSAPSVAPPNAQWIGFVTLLITALGWALNWPAMKLLLREWPPLTSRGAAGVAAALILAVIAAGRGERLHVGRRTLPRLLFAAFTNVFAWMGFSTIAMKWVSVGEGALLVYSMPIWATLFAWPILGTRPSARGFAALLLGMAGVSVLLSGQRFGVGGNEILGVVLALAAAICFALGTVLNRSPIPVPPIALVAWQVGLGCLPMVLLGLAFEHPRLGDLTVSGWAVLAYMTIVPMGVCYLTWFATLRTLPPATASTGMLLVPVIGIISAAWMLGEPFGIKEVVAMALTLGGVTLALQRS